MDSNAEELAKQFTMSEWLLFSKILPKEFIGIAWQGKDKEKLAPNLTTLTTRFNQVKNTKFYIFK